MKKMIALTLALVLALGLCACSAAPSGSEEPVETTTTVPTDPTYTFDAGFTVTLPEGFEVQESLLNDFFGTGDKGAYAIIANKDLKAEFESVEQFANALATANDADGAKQDAAGNYYITYLNASNNHRFYTTIREGETYIYRIAFYCSDESWSQYEPLFTQWASTIVVE